MAPSKDLTPNGGQRSVVFFDSPPANGYEKRVTADLGTAAYVPSGPDAHERALAEMRKQAEILARGFHPDADGFHLRGPNIQQEETDNGTHLVIGTYDCDVYQRKREPN